MSLNIPVSYDDETRMLSVSEEWAGTTIDDRSTTFIVSGIPEDVKSAKLDVKVAVRSAKGKTVRPFMILKGIESGVGSATVPAALFDACKRDRKFIFQLELMTEFETYASKNWITLKVSDAVFRTPSGMDLYNQDQVLIDAYEVESEGKIVFKRFSGEEFSILLKDNDVEWGVIKNIPWRSTWSTGTPTDKEILTESLVRGALDEKTSIVAAIPEWDMERTFRFRSSVIFSSRIFQSKQNDNKGHAPPTEEEGEENEWWKVLSASGGTPPQPVGSKTFLVGDGVNTEFSLFHEFGTIHVFTSIVDNSTSKFITAETWIEGEDEIVVKFATPPAVEQMEVTVFCGNGTNAPLMIPVSEESTEWTIDHNLGRKPLVEVFNGSGDLMLAEVFQYNVNRLYVTFEVPTSGYVLLR